LIQGPPGTGKTHTILGLISLFLLNNDGKILICAPSNTAIDEISARIVNKGILNENLLVNNNVNFIRFGLYDRKEKENKYLFTTNGKLIQ
jgi:senataxin